MTCDNLIWRGYTMTSWCCMCRYNGESMDHCLFTAQWREPCGILFFVPLGFSGCFPKQLVDLLDGWWNMLGRHTSCIWNLVPPCLMWTVWRERNRRTFEDWRNQRVSSWIILFFCYLSGPVLGVSHLALLLCILILHCL